MVSVRCEDGEFQIKGTFDMGIAGVFENKEYNEGNMELGSFLSDIDSIEKYLLKASYIEEDSEIKQIFTGVPREGEVFAKIIEDYLNRMEEKVQKNSRQIKDYFLYRVLEDWADCETPFWECEEAILPEYREKYTEDDYLQVYENEEFFDKMKTLCAEYDNAPNDGSMEKTDVEALAKKLFPMFDFDGFMQSIQSDVLVFQGYGICVQISDDWGSRFYCSACETFDEKLAPTEWVDF